MAYSRPGAQVTPRSPPVTPGTKLRLLREKKGLNKSQFTKLVQATGQNISPAYINNLERGAANSEHLGVHYLKAFAAVLEVREFVVTSELRDADIQTDPAAVLVQEVFETFLARNPGAVPAAEIELLRRLVKEAGGPKWCRNWPEQYQILKRHRALVLGE